MKSKRVWRYYCEFCKKSGCGKHAMEQHEKYCTMNPNRKCRMCEIAELQQKPIETLKSLAHYSNFSLGLIELRDVTENCPACILAAFRQAGIHPRDHDFDYQKECKEFWEVLNDERTERETYNPY